MVARKTAADLLALVGLGMVVGGAFAISVAAGIVALGAILTLVAVVMALSESASP